MSTLDVQLFGQLAGALSIIDGGDPRFPEDWAFQYASAYLDARRPPLSLSLPLSESPCRGAGVRNWFANLLPEGLVREAIARRLRIDVGDSFALLAALGGECAGAVSILPTGDAVHICVDRIGSIEAALTGIGLGNWSLLGGPRRQSLAGAQDKLVVVRDAAGLRLPEPGEPSTHILKPDSPRLRGLCDLELLGLRLADAMQLPVAKAECVNLAGTRALLVERYDRVQVGGRIERLHQEDFCQALGFPPEAKYQAGGGPTLGSFSTLIREHRMGPKALRAFLDWVIAAALIGNADAHGKNLALLRSPTGALQLAPCYDLVPTIVWPESILDRRPALSIGGAPRIDQIGAAHWTAFARETGFRPLFVHQRVRTLAGFAKQSLPGVLDRLVLQGADPALLGTAERALTAQFENALSTA